MEISHDPQLNVAYIKFSEKKDHVQTLQLSEDFMIDIGPDGKVYGIELLNANAQLAGDIDKLQYINSISGVVQEISLSDTHIRPS